MNAQVDDRLANLGDGGISDKAKAYAATLPDRLSYHARNMLADFVTRSNASGTTIENWLGVIAQELVDAGYLEPAEGLPVLNRAPSNEPFTAYLYTNKVRDLRKSLRSEASI